MFENFFRNILLQILVKSKDFFNRYCVMADDLDKLISLTTFLCGI